VPPSVRGFFASVSEGSDAPEFYRAGFYNFLIPHEMSHFVDYERGRGPTAEQRYDSELKANRIAVAFWIARAGGLDWLSRLTCDLLLKKLDRFELEFSRFALVPKDEERR